MRNPFARLAQRDTARPSLRERAASLKASAARVIRREPKGALPEAGSEEATALFHAAIKETDRLSRDAVHGYSELKREDMEWWTCHTLRMALEAGEIAPTEAAALYRLAAEREHRIRAAALATDAGALQILAYADDYSRIAATPDAEPDTAEDPIFAAIAETKRLQGVVRAASALPQPAGTIDPLPEQVAAMAASSDHIDHVLVKTVPTTAAGCAALARYALDFLDLYHFPIDEPAGDAPHVRILELISRSPLLDGAPVVRPPVPDFSGYSVNDLMRTYNAFKLATDILGLSTFATSPEGKGDDLLDAECDRLSFFQGFIADELGRRDGSGHVDDPTCFDTRINHAVACGDYDEVARLGSKASARSL